VNTDKRSSPAAERRQQCFALHLTGSTYAEIAIELGISRQACYGLVQRELARLNTQTERDAGVLRQLELSRLDSLVRACWKKAMAGNLGAIDRLLKISERRSRLLGLDRPVKTALDLFNTDVRIYLPDNHRNPTFNQENNDESF